MNLITLSNIEIEKVAEAIDTHPGRIAFPGWDDIAFKAVNCKLLGISKINGTKQSGEISGCASYMGGLKLKFGGRKHLNLLTFGPIPSARKPELRLEIRGDEVGTLNDVYQAGPYFDGDTRKISEVKMLVNIFANGVLYNISGFAESNSEPASPRPNDSPSGDWSFTISFFVNPEQLRDFFGIYQEPSERMIISMFDLPKWSGKFDG